ncbi:hypothetical protein [uncultured Kordia sp.]|uniref:NACHT domain-containing protein n=1 Tax=uncultured Kordia sp. TaxID=507699 RepID=UPI002638DA1F|nr:hypothetical protein [uncultured Kordia sp.]
MKELLNDLVVYFCELFGCPEGYENSILFGITLLFILFFIISYICKGILKLVKWRNKRLLNKNLKPYFTPLDVEKYTKYYITQYYQGTSPANEEEPNPRHISIPRQKIITLFTNEVFKQKSANKYFIVLAGAGMGKTAFMINLYLKHLNGFKNPFTKQKLAIKLFPLGAKDILKKVELVPDKNNTILLLDALDEDTEALKDYEKRISTILNICNEFNIIVITCRTQFFSSALEEPYETGKFSYGENGQYYFKKIYLSPFNYIDIKKYINKRFKYYELNKKKEAKKVIKKSESLLVRPMLLSHIEDLIKFSADKLTTLEIYNILVDKWLEREAKKPGIQAKFGSYENYKKLLKKFSIQLSKKMYLDKDEKKGLFIHHSSDFKVKGFSFSELEKEFFDNKSSYIKSKSLLNRDSTGNYKFSHKSIFEYFFALNLINNPKLILNVDYKSFDMTKLFLLDLFKSNVNEYYHDEFVIFLIVYNSLHISAQHSSKNDNILILEYKKDSTITLPLQFSGNRCVIYCNSFNIIYCIDEAFQFFKDSSFHYKKLFFYEKLKSLGIHDEDFLYLDKYFRRNMKREILIRTHFLETKTFKHISLAKEVIKCLPEFKLFLDQITQLESQFPHILFIY